MASSPVSARAQPPPPDGKTDVLLRFFDSEFFDEWVAISYLWRTTNEGVIDYLCNRMYSLSDERIERYLSQIITLQIQRPNASLERTIVGFCKRSIRLGAQTCWLLAAASGDSKRPKPILELRHRCEVAAMNGKWLPPFRALSPMLDHPPMLDADEGAREPESSEKGSGRRPRARSADDAFASADFADDGIDALPGSPSAMAGVYAGGGDDRSSRSSARGPSDDSGKDAAADPDPAVSDGATHHVAAGLGKIRVRGDSAAGRELDVLDAAEAAAFATQRVDTFASTLRLADDLCGLSMKLSTVFPPEGRQGQLQAGIERVSEALVEGHVPGGGVMFPMGTVNSRVVRIPAGEAVLLNSREKAPYLLCLEVIVPEGASEHGSSAEGSPTAERGAGSSRHSRQSSDSSPLHDMSTPVWSTRSGPSAEDIERAAAQHAANAAGPGPGPGRPASPVPPLHPGLNGFAARSGGGPSAAGALQRAGRSMSNIETTVHASIHEDHQLAPAARDNREREKPRRRGSADGTLSGLPPLSPASTSPGDSPTRAGAEAAGGGGSHRAASGPFGFPGGAVSVKPSHQRTRSFEIISNKVDMALAQVWRGDEPIVRVSLSVTTSPRGGFPLEATSWFGRGKGEDGGGSGGGGAEPPPVRVTLFVENPAPGKLRVASPPHKRTPSDVGMTEMATMINRRGRWATPAGARDATAPPDAAAAVDGAATASSPLRPRSAGPGREADKAHKVPSPWKRSAGGLGEKWEDKMERVRKSSPYGEMPGWTLKPVIIKAGDNCRQELLALQMTKMFAKIYRESGLPLWLRPFDVIATSTTSAFIEAVTDAPSIHAVKSRAPRDTSLRRHFEAKFGKGGTPGFRTAQRNFVESLAGYSILTYILQVKDRHNGNILLHDDGHLIHIDFNFMLSTSPGGINFESSPFKLTREYLEVMDSDDTGTASEAFNYYKVLCIQGYLAVRKHAERIILLVEMMSASGCPCFKAGPRVLNNLRRRFNLGATEEECVEIMLSMISDSMDAWSTRQYDFYQRVLNGIL